MNQIQSISYLLVTDWIILLLNNNRFLTFSNNILGPSNYFCFIRLEESKIIIFKYFTFQIYHDHPAKKKSLQTKNLVLLLNYNDASVGFLLNVGNKHAHEMAQLNAMDWTTIFCINWSSLQFKTANSIIKLLSVPLLRLRRLLLSESTFLFLFEHICWVCVFV